MHKEVLRRTTKIQHIILFFVITVLACIVASKTEALTCTNFIGTCSACQEGSSGPTQTCNISNYGSTHNEGSCSGCTNWDGNFYTYTDYQSKANFDAAHNPYQCYSSTQTVGTHQYAIPHDSDVSACYWDDVPLSCNHGYNVDNCVSGGGGQCSGEGTREFGHADCPLTYVGQACGTIPCGWRLECGCDCDCDSNCHINPITQQCDMGGGGGGPSPTPTPAPSCDLVCSFGGAGGLGGGAGGAGGSSPQGGAGPTIVPPRAEGELQFTPRNNFNCGTFDDGLENGLPCPTTGAGGGGVQGSGSWNYPVTYNMLCGEQSQTYTATAYNNGGGSGGAGGAQGGLTPTAGPTPTGSIYPIGCSIGGPTPTTGASQGGTGGTGGAGTQSCSCAVTLSCQNSIQSSPNDPTSIIGAPSCLEHTCNFTVDPEYPLFTQDTIFHIDAQSEANGFDFNFNDNSGTSTVGDVTSTTHSFVNAGIYDVTMTCKQDGAPLGTCTRRLNTYCNNGVVPTATPTPQPTQTPWYKIQDGAYNRESPIVDSIPVTAISYDNDDTGSCSQSDQTARACLISGEAGPVLSEGSISLGDGIPASYTDWKKADTIITRRFTPTTYSEYVQSRKKTTAITNFSDITTAGIYTHEGDLSASNSDVASLPNGVVVIITGDMTITDSLTNLRDKAVAFVITNDLNIEENAQELHGIYITKNVDFASNVASTDKSLKIIGNLVAQNPSSTISKRFRIDNPNKPSIFVKVNLKTYIGLLPYLSIHDYIQEEVAQ